MKDLISRVTHSFYEKAVTDIIIGHQFRKIQEYQGDHPLRPPIDAFKEHLPRINDFWEIQLLEKRKKVSPPFDLFKVHAALNIRMGELNRWLFLFRETLSYFEKICSSKEEQSILKLWREKVDFFEDKFKNNLFRS